MSVGRLGANCISMTVKNEIVIVGYPCKLRRQRFLEMFVKRLEEHDSIWWKNRIFEGV